MKVAYYPGCSARGTARELGMSAEALCEALDIQLEEIPDWSCCGATSAHSLDAKLAVALPARDLRIAGEISDQLVTPCAACFNRLKTAAKAQAEQGNGKVVRVDHLLGFIGRHLDAATVEKKRQRWLGGLKIACYYGCLLVRPPEITEFDDPENPTVMDRLLAATGAEPVDWPYKTECCGGAFALVRPSSVERLSGAILKAAKEAGAHCIVTACPLCQANLEFHQGAAGKLYGENLRIPVLGFTELLGYSLGVDPKRLGLDRHIVSPLPLLLTREANA
jgi:heterodisulfide reductase subunit B